MKLLSKLIILFIFILVISCKQRMCPKVDLRKIGYDTSFYDTSRTVIILNDTLKILRTNSELINKEKEKETFMNLGECSNGYYYTLRIDSTDIYVDMYFIATDNGHVYGANSYYFDYFDIKIDDVSDIDTIVNCNSSSPYSNIHIYQGKIINVK